MGQNELCSLGNSTSESSEKLLQRGKGEGQRVRDFSKGGIHAVMHIFFGRKFLEVSTGLMKLLLVMRNNCHHERF